MSTPDFQNDNPYRRSERSSLGLAAKRARRYNSRLKREEREAARRLRPWDEERDLIARACGCAFPAVAYGDYDYSIKMRGRPTAVYHKYEEPYGREVFTDQTVRDCRTFITALAAARNETHPARRDTQIAARALVAIDLVFQGVGL